jgi:hypothetical protein
LRLGILEGLKNGTMGENVFQGINSILVEIIMTSPFPHSIPPWLRRERP